jgi:DNA-directed RNA polymerase specialized sigma24 family protein
VALSRVDFENAFQELEISLYNFALRWVFQTMLAEEIVQDAFAIVWKNRAVVDFSRSSFARCSCSPNSPI